MRGRPGAQGAASAVGFRDNGKSERFGVGGRKADVWGLGRPR